MLKIDDAQSYGYRTREKARQGYYFLSKQKYLTDKEYKNKRKAVSK